ncbi:MAG: DUF1127 domain-containing protein [Rhodospirillales bacterium]|nr:DUF1127 domain-containing protein [Rhodospirillales bacterium]MDH3790463.1 DUF1127 domain-containing protein [Rhodospirillales bacterium]MDH3909941.1 DUF1127 domain-containing protein [Rhodospirillales bacterium]MDH3968946.1 DUF1127 domain-containing protein [Rhodospirillales bacterium]
MARLTDRELDLIQQARRSTTWREWSDIETILIEARRERSRVVAQMLRAGLAGLARVTGLRAAVRFVADRIVRPVRRDLLQRRTVRELRQLDNHMLYDIGLDRDEVDRVAKELAWAALPALQAQTGFITRIWRWHKRRAAIRELEALDDRILADIGLVRGGIDEAVDRAAAARMAEQRTAPFLLSPLHAWNPGRQAAGLMTRFRQWLQRRATIRELQALDDRMLADIGLLRPDIPAAMDRLAAGKAETGQPTFEQSNYWDSVVRTLRQSELSREAAREIVRNDPDGLIDLGHRKADLDWAPAGMAGPQPNKHEAA